MLVVVPIGVVVVAVHLFILIYSLSVVVAVEVLITADCDNVALPSTLANQHESVNDMQFINSMFTCYHHSTVAFDSARQLRCTNSAQTVSMYSKYYIVIQKHFSCQLGSSLKVHAAGNV